MLPGSILVYVAISPVGVAVRPVDWVSVGVVAVHDDATMTQRGFRSKVYNFRYTDTPLSRGLK